MGSDLFSLEYLKKLADEHLVPFVINLVIAVVIFYVGRTVARVVTKATAKVLTRGKVDGDLVKFMSDVLYTLLYAIVIIAALERLGVRTTAAIALIGAAGLAVGLAMQGSLGNFASGVMIIIFKPYRIGDLVALAGYTGDVEGIHVFNTVVITRDGKKIIIPNGQITGSVIENISARGKIRVDMVFGIGYRDDIDKAKSVLKAILAADDRVMQDPAPQVAVSELGESSVNFVVRPWVHPDVYWDAMFDITERVKKEFDKNGISIPFPQRDVHLFQAQGDVGKAA